MTGVKLLTIAITLGAVVAWLSAVVHPFWALRHLSGKSTRWQMIFSGMRWFDSENFTPRGQQLLGRWGISLAALVGFGIARLVIDALFAGGN